MVEKEPQPVDLSVLSNLSEMRGVQRELKQLVVEKQAIEDATVREILARGLESYNAPAAKRRFADKADSLEQIINLFNQGLVTKDQLLEAAEAEAGPQEEKEGFFKKVLEKFGR
jgi:hypothetical protein